MFGVPHCVIAIEVAAHDGIRVGGVLSKSFIALLPGGGVYVDNFVVDFLNSHGHRDDGVPTLPRDLWSQVNVFSDHCCTFGFLANRDK